MKITYQVQTGTQPAADENDPPVPVFEDRTAESDTLEGLRAALAAAKYAGPLLVVPGVGLVNATHYYEHAGT